MKRLGLLLIEKAPLFLAGEVVVALTFRAETRVGALSLNPAQPLGFRLEKMLNTYWQYIASGFWPAKLSVLYPPPASFPWWRTAWPVVFFAALSLAWQSRRQIAVWRNTLTLFDHANRVTKNNYVAMNNVAWVLATDPRDNRSPEARALDYAREACKLTKYQADRMLDTLALCLANTGHRLQARSIWLQAAAIAQRQGRPRDTAAYLRKRGACVLSTHRPSLSHPIIPQTH